MVNVQTLLWQASDWLVGTILPAVVVEQTNRERQTDQLSGLRRNEQLDRAATLKATHMATQGYFAHYSPDGTSPWHWFDEVGYTYAHAGENLAVHFKDSRALVKAWMDSPTHRANIMNGVYQEIGVGTAEGEFQGHKTIFVVQLFGTPAAPIQPYVPPAVPAVPPSSLVVATPAVEPLPVPVAEPTLAPVVSEVGQMIDDEPSFAVESSFETESPAVLAEQSGENGAELVDFPRLVDEGSKNSVTNGQESFVAISSDLIPAAIDPVAPHSATAGSSVVSRLSTTPNTVLQVMYTLLGMVIAALLFASVILAFRFGRPVQVVYGVALLMLMTGLFYLHSIFTAAVVIAAPLT